CHAQVSRSVYKNGGHWKYFSLALVAEDAHQKLHQVRDVNNAVSNKKVFYHLSLRLFDN
ncbi:hypothetical protein RRG08_019125, partial [Elysia crispata]